MSVSPPGSWLLNRIVYLINKTLELINTTVSRSIQDLLNNANTFKGINTFTQGIDVNNINSINGNTRFNSNIVVDGDIVAQTGNVTTNHLFADKNITCSETISASNYIASNTNYFNIGSYLSKHLKVMSISTTTVGFIYTNLNSPASEQMSLLTVDLIFAQSKFFTLSHPINTEIGHWTTGIDLNILSSGYSGIMQDYQNFKFAISYKVTNNSVNLWDNNGETFPQQNDFTGTFTHDSYPETIYIKKFKTWDIDFYFIGRWKRALDSDGNPVTADINVFEIAIFNSPTTDPNYETNVRYVLDMTISKPSPHTIITI